VNRPRTLAAACVALLVVAGCGGDDAEPSGAEPTTATAAGTTAPTDGTTAPPGTGEASTAPPDSGATATDSPATATTAPPTTIAAGSIGDGQGAALGDPVAGIADATTLAVRPGDDAAYVAGRDGTIWAWRAGAEPVVVLDLTDRTEGGGEQGLLGLAFSPDGGHAYVNYTGADDGGDTHVDEFAVGADGTIDPASRREVLVVEQPYSNHNGGQLVFGPDGLLYIGLGDGGSGGDPERRALDLGELLGKILRIDPTGDPYTVPADNPFVGTDGARPEIWSFGLRNPWRFSFDQGTGDLWIGDVGQGEWEEIDHAPATGGVGAGRGASFGWSALEGTHPYNDDQSADGAIPPIFEYSHDEGCSVTGGEVYRGAAIPGLLGWYVFADYCGGTVWALQLLPGPDGTLTAGERIDVGRSADVSAIETGPDGELYVLSLSQGIIPIVPA